MAGKKKARDFNVIDITPNTPIDIDSVVIDKTPEISTPEPTSKSVFQSYNWWIDNVKNETWAYNNDAFGDEELLSLIRMGQSPETSAANEGDVDPDGIQNRSWIRSDIELNRWVFQKLAGIVGDINTQFFNYDISYIDTLQFVRIDENSTTISGKYIDLTYNSTGTKKLAFFVQLSDPADYEEGHCMIHTSDAPIPLPKNKGAVTVFPSFVLREFTPVTKGVNYVLVGTVIGPRFK